MGWLAVIDRGTRDLMDLRETTAMHIRSFGTERELSSAQ